MTGACAWRDKEKSADTQACGVGKVQRTQTLMIGETCTNQKHQNDVARPKIYKEPQRHTHKTKHGSLRKPSHDANKGAVRQKMCE